MTKTPPVEGTRAISPMLVEKVERSSWAYWWCVLIGVLGLGLGLEVVVEVWVGWVLRFGVD